VQEVARTVLDTAWRYSADDVASAAVSRAVAAGCHHEAFVKALASSLITNGDALRDRAPARAFLSWSCVIVASLDLSAVWTKKVHTHPSSTSSRMHLTLRIRFRANCSVFCLLSTALQGERAERRAASDGSRLPKLR